MLIHTPRRRAATLVEGAIVASTLFLLLFVLLVGALGVSRYQELSAVAREAARYASVHGGQYAQETGNGAASASDVYTNVVQPMGVAMNLQQSNVTVQLKTWTVNADGSVSATTQDWDSSDKYPYVVTSSNGGTTSTSVVVTITYTWAPEIFGDSVPMSSTAEVPMSY